MADTWLDVARSIVEQRAKEVERVLLRHHYTEADVEMLADFGKLVMDEAQFRVQKRYGTRKRTEAEVLAAVEARLEKR